MSKRPPNPSEFDSYAENYSALIRDPLREKFTASDRFFAERKIQVIQRFYNKQGIDTRKLAWLDVGCGKGDLLRLGKSQFGTATGTGVITLGRGESKEKVKEWLSVGAKIRGIIGFAVGRTIFWDALQGIKDGKHDRQAAVEMVAQNYKEFVQLWQSQKL